MTESRCRLVLTVNAGSSSLKISVYQMGGGANERRLLRLEASRISSPKGWLHVLGPGGERLFDAEQGFPDFSTALDAALRWTERTDHPLQPDVVAHRIVHGGTRYWEPTTLTPDVVAALESLVPLDPEHLPQAIECVRGVAKVHPDLPQVACFDTGFHHTMPPVARTYPIPWRFSQDGIVRFGFHGLSYEYVCQRIRELEGSAGSGRMIVAHLGNGASMAALRDGQSIDTTMGFTPMGGLVMGTRSGDLDPGLVLYLLRHEGLTPEQLTDVLGNQSGLLGVSETSQDMRDLLEREAEDPRAALAIDLFCYRAAKGIGAYAAALGGLDLLVFTAGIGERAAPIRERICGRLGFLGVELDPERNRNNDRVISRDGCRVTVRVVKTNEELMIARHADRLVT